MKKYFIILLSLLFFSTIIYAKNITGKVIDSKNQPLEFANVLILNANDSSFVEGTVTDNTGKFLLQSGNENYLLKVSFIGYQTKILNIKDENIDIITLDPAENMLEEVAITATRPTIRMENGGISTDVQNSYLKTLGTANEVLAQLPFVNREKDKITVFGKGEPLIYINNRQVRDLAELEQLNSDQIKKITVVTNPGVEYGAEIQSVIRIETIRKVGEGLSGNVMLRSTIDKRFSHNETGNLNYRKGNLDLFGMLRYGKTGDLQLIDLSQKTASNDVTTEVTQKGRQEQNRQYYRANIGANYVFNNNHSAGVKFENVGDITNNFLFDAEFIALKNNIPDEQFRSITNNANSGKPVSNYLNAYYEGKITAWLSAKLDIDYANGRESNNHITENFRSDSLETVWTRDGNHYDLYASKLILTSPLWQGLLNYGYEFSRTINNQNFNVIQTGESEFLETSQNTAKQSLNALFFSFTKPFGKFVATGSLRYENVDFKYFSNGEKEEEPSRTYNNVFPSASIAYQNDGLQMQLGYRNSTGRPGYYQLRNEIQYDNPYTYEGGNPYLKPVYINTLSYTLVWKDLQTDIAYNFYKNRILFTPLLLSEDVIFMQPNNLKSSQTFVFTAAYSPTIKIWKPSLQFAFMKDFVSLGNPPMSYNQPMVQIALKNSILLFKDLRFGANFTYNSKGNEDMIYVYDNFQADLTLSKYFFNNKLRINIGANDIFGTSCQKVLLETREIWSHIRKDLNTRNVNISISYNFNATKSKYKGEQASDELNRLQ